MHARSLAQRLPFVFAEKLKILGSAFCRAEISFLILIYEFLRLRSVNYEAFKYTCALHTEDDDEEEKKKQTLLLEYAPSFGRISRARKEDATNNDGMRQQQQLGAQYSTLSLWSMD